MKNKYDKNFYVGLDIGTDSVGYAVTDEQYNLLRFHGDDAWGSTVFDAASLKAERRSFRSARRRLERKKQRVKLLQEIFAEEIAKVDKRFFVRLDGSYLWREDTEDKYTVFEDDDYTDVQYHWDYPTIHHLICELMNHKEEHDVRLVYLACAWLVSHRGHFLSNIDEKNLDDIKDITTAYNKFERFFQDNGYVLPWNGFDMDGFGKALKEKVGVTAKKNKLVETLLNGRKPSKEISEEFPFHEDSMLKLLAGGTCKVKDLYGKEEYTELGSFSLGMEEEKFAELMMSIGEDYDLVAALRELYDWAILADTLGDSATISQSKVAVYEQHKADLKLLKYFVKKYCPEKYEDVFRSLKADNYVAYSYHTDVADPKDLKKKAGVEEFSKYILKVVKGIKPDEEDGDAYDDMITRLELRAFLPKQKNTDNRIIPHQLYLYELKKILDNASHYLDFLNNEDDNHISNKEKIEAIFKFKLPYFVGPLNKKSSFSWVVRSDEKITPWNYDKVIDFDASEQEFIKKMTNQCTYLPGEPVLPKDSLCYRSFMVLNEINNIKIDGVKIPVEAKQGIYQQLFAKKKKVRRKDIVEYLISNNYLEKGNEGSLSGIDIEIKSSLSTHIAFARLLKNGALQERDVEKIIERASYAEDKSRVVKWLEKNYAELSKEDIKYISGIKIKDFGRLSKHFLTELEGMSRDTGEILNILRAMWETNDNLMELLSERYTFAEKVAEFRTEYYAEHKKTLEDRLDDMYVSNAVRRPIYRTLDIMNDIYKAFGTPKKIFIEMTRGADPDRKGKRTSSRREQILDVYKKCKEEDVVYLKQQLESLGEYADSKLQGDKLFLYFMQFGRSAYSGKPIQIEKLLNGSKEYDIDHIYPQAYVKDDSIINNKVLVYSEENGRKKDDYPIEKTVRDQMTGMWNYWKTVGTISDEKYKRLVRTTRFTDDEKYGFINRQLTETSQSTKAIADLLKEKFPKSEIVYTKAKITSEFRKKYDLPKARTYNDLHHAVDAYLNIVTGNVYHMRFSRQWFRIDSRYSIKIETLFKHPVQCGETVVWDGEKMLGKVIKTAKKNTAHFTKYASFKTGGLFAQQPKGKNVGVVPIKKGLPTEKYGGYYAPGEMFFVPIRYTTSKKSEIIVMAVELMYGKRFLQDVSFAKEYAVERLQHILGKEVSKIEFPMGMRPWKVNTMLSLDGFRVCITGGSSKGSRLIAQPVVQFASDEFWKFYVSKLEKFTEKCSNNPNHMYDERYDVVNAEKNLELYDVYIDKLTNSIYRKRLNSPLTVLVTGRDKFIDLDIKEQSKVLMNIQQVFGRMTSGCDLESIGGSKNSAATKVLSATVSNWKKNYSDVRIIDQSASGLWEKQSANLLELL